MTGAESGGNSNVTCIILRHSMFNLLRELMASDIINIAILIAESLLVAACELRVVQCVIEAALRQ